MEVDDAIHCVYMAEGIEWCPTCGEDLSYEIDRKGFRKYFSILLR